MDRPGVIDDILAGIVWEFEITQTFATTALTLMAIPTLMILLSTTLPARANRATNLVVASLPASSMNDSGTSQLLQLLEHEGIAEAHDFPVDLEDRVTTLVHDVEILAVRDEPLPHRIARHVVRSQLQLRRQA